MKENGLTEALVAVCVKVGKDAYAADHILTQLWQRLPLGQTMQYSDQRARRDIRELLCLATSLSKAKLDANDHDEVSRNLIVVSTCA